MSDLPNPAPRNVSTLGPDHHASAPEKRQGNWSETDPAGSAAESPVVQQSMVHQPPRQYHIPHVPERTITPAQVLLDQFNDQRLQARRQERMMYDFSHPVDEYVATGPLGWPNGGVMNIVPTWEVTERIEAIIVGLPIGVTSAIVQLSDRYIPIYVGPALAQSQTFVLQNVGIIMQRDDARQLNLLPVALNIGPVLFELTGFASNTWDAA